MGYNTVAVIMNDAAGQIADDPNIGKSIKDAMQEFRFVRGGYSARHCADVAAHSESGGIFCNAMTIVSQDHSSGWQIVGVGKNCGYRMGAPDLEEVPDEVLSAAARALEAHGYKVTKPKAKTGEPVRR